MVSDDFVTTIRRRGASAMGVSGPAGRATQERILGLLRAHPEMTRTELAERIEITSDGIEYHRQKMRTERRIRHVGPTKKGRWEVLEDAHE